MVSGGEGWASGIPSPPQPPPGGRSPQLPRGAVPHGGARQALTALRELSSLLRLRPAPRWWGPGTIGAGNRVGRTVPRSAPPVPLNARLLGRACSCPAHQGRGASLHFKGSLRPRRHAGARSCRHLPDVWTFLLAGSCYLCSIPTLMWVHTCERALPGPESSYKSGPSPAVLQPLSAMNQAERPRAETKPQGIRPHICCPPPPRAPTSLGSTPLLVRAKPRRAGPRPSQPAASEPCAVERGRDSPQEPSDPFPSEPGGWGRVGEGEEGSGRRDTPDLSSRQCHGAAGQGTAPHPHPGKRLHRRPFSPLQPPTAAGWAPTSPRATRARARSAPQRPVGPAGGSGGRGRPSPRSRSAGWRRPSSARSTWGPRSGGSWQLPCICRRYRWVREEADPSRVGRERGSAVLHRPSLCWTGVEDFSWV